MSGKIRGRRERGREVSGKNREKGERGCEV